MKLKLIIRFADPEEYPRVAELISLARCRTMTADDMRLEEKFKTPGTAWYWWVAIHEDVIVAAAQAVHFGSQLAGRFRLDIAVDPLWRKQGVSQALLAHVRTYLPARGATRLVCELNDGLDEGLRFAQSTDLRWRGGILARYCR
ncbi:MAG: GNAT family N-acetyltransferase [Chloroflexota bacterium]